MRRSRSIRVAQPFAGSASTSAPHSVAGPSAGLKRVGIWVRKRCSAIWGRTPITDAGMTGVRESVIGVRPEMAIRRFLTQIPNRFKPAEGKATLCGALIEADETSGRATRIERLQQTEA